MLRVYLYEYICIDGTITTNVKNNTSEIIIVLNISNFYLNR